MVNLCSVLGRMATQAQVFPVATVALISFLCLHQACGNFFSSLQFTRESLMQFSRGSERTVEIVTPKMTTKKFKQTKPVVISLEKDSSSLGHGGTRFTMHAIFPAATGKPGRPKPTTTRRPVTQTVRRVYRPRLSPSNKFLEVLNDIERSVANAKASQIPYTARSLPNLESLVEKAVKSKSYKYARQVLGQIMYILSTRPEAKRRGKRSSQRDGSNFLNGLRQRVGSTTFDSFMAVQGDVSLMFVMDDTGSMREEITAAKSIAIDIINYPRDNPIVSYILSPFNDPYPDDPGVVVSDESKAVEFVEAINNLQARGGGDCPEYTFKGILEALYQDPAWGSPMYVFTDAGPKDATDYYIEEVMALAGAYEYGVTINFFTTGYCSSPLNNGGLSDLHPAFRQLAEATSGQAIALRDDWELEQLNTLTGGGLDGDNVVSFGSNVSNRKKRSASQASYSRYSIPVDDSMEKMVITVTTSRHNTNGEGITLKDPDDSIIVSGKLNLSQISVYQIDNPKKGAWVLTISGRNGEHEFYVKSSSATNVDFDHYFLTTVPGRRRLHNVEVPVSHPVIDKHNTLVITLAGSEKVDTSSLRLQLITKEGDHISDLILQSRDTVHFTASFTTSTAQIFKLKLLGNTRSGTPFQRISRQVIKSSTTVLRVKSATNDYTLPLHRFTTIHFQLCKFGKVVKFKLRRRDRVERFNVTVVKDRMQYLLTRRVASKHVLTNRCATISVRATATRPEDVGKTDTVFVMAKGESGTIVSATARLFVVSNVER